MSHTSLPRSRAAAVAVASLLVLGGAAPALAAADGGAPHTAVPHHRAPLPADGAATEPLSGPHITNHFKLAASQQPENITVDRTGTAYLTFSFARQIVRVAPGGRPHVLATLPAPAKAATPNLGKAFVGGIARGDDGTLYVAYATGTADLTGIWAVRPGGRPHRIAALPADGLPNGLALDRRTGKLYVTDSVHGVVYRVPEHGGETTVWAKGTELEPSTFAGANGLKLHNGAVWATNLDKGTVLRIPVTARGTAGRIQVRATGMPSIDDFSFTGHGDTLLAARDDNEVDLVRPDGTHTAVLTAADGLQTPTSIAVHGSKVYVPSAAYLTNKDPNLLVAHLGR
ncbi:SMP-30/gluconolactonase/LRE family protein [Streptomyces sp. SAS_270]|uniref:SMP-30/gluconolactonase/LRE family protein n=1 Tax=Streptomyces sp. SAS_270 TaxID=3412748 RepID=UPI00403CD57D